MRLATRTLNAHLTSKICSWWPNCTRRSNTTKKAMIDHWIPYSCWSWNWFCQNQLKNDSNRSPWNWAFQLWIIFSMSFPFLIHWRRWWSNVSTCCLVLSWRTRRVRQELVATFPTSIQSSLCISFRTSITSISINFQKDEKPLFSHLVAAISSWSILLLKL